MPDGNGQGTTNATNVATGTQGNQSATGSAQGNQGATQPTAPATFDAWLESQAPEIKGLYEAHTKGLRNALVAERSERDALAKQMREASGKLEAGSEAQKALQAIQAKYEALERRQSFTDEAVKPGIGCTDARLAYLAALEIGAISDKGKIDWDTLRQQFPALFKSAVGNANAGTGTGAPPPVKVDMNQMLRRAAGRTK